MNVSLVSSSSLVTSQFAVSMGVATYIAPKYYQAIVREAPLFSKGRRIVTIAQKEPAEVFGEKVLCPIIEKTKHVGTNAIKLFKCAWKLAANFVNSISLPGAYAQRQMKKETVFLQPESTRFQTYRQKQNLTKKCTEGMSGKRCYFINDLTFQSSKPRDLFVYLHGLEAYGEVSLYTLDIFKEIEWRMRDKNCISLFPLGLRGIFPGQRDALAWNPDSDGQNFNFLKDIVGMYRTSHHVHRVFLGGFSNGAFFISDLIQNGEEDLFDGYWLQSGGNKKTNSQFKGHKKVVLEVGNNDHWHFKNVVEFQNHLYGNGSGNKKKLLFRVFDGGHVVNLDRLEDNLHFLREE